MCGGGCWCTQCNFCFGTLMYIFERLAICCAMCAVITCIIITVLVSLGLGVGVGYNYSIIDFKSHQLEDRVMAAKKLNYSVANTDNLTNPSIGPGTRRDSGIKWGPIVEFENYGSKVQSGRSSGPVVPVLLEKQVGQDISRKLEEPEGKSKPKITDGPKMPDGLVRPHGPELSDGTRMPKEPNIPVSTRLRDRLGLKVQSGLPGGFQWQGKSELSSESKILGETKSSSKSPSLPKVPDKRRKLKFRKSGSAENSKSEHGIHDAELSATNIVTWKPSRTVLDISDESDIIDEPETEPSPTRTPTQTLYWQHPLWQTSFRDKEIILSDFQFPQNTNANSNTKQTSVKYIDDTERKKALYKSLQLSAVDMNNKEPKLPSITIPLNDTNISSLLSEILRQKQNITLQFLNT